MEELHTITSKGSKYIAIQST